MKINVLKAENFKTSKWSGGTTTELYIYPPEADYKDLDFKFRISTAKVELEKSDFTPLKGISRKLMILDGDIEIHHKNRYSKKLSKFDIDCFEGDWDTSSKGKCRDFNIMCTANTSSKISVLKTENNKSKKIQVNSNNSHLLLYCISGTTNISINNESLSIQKGELVVIEENTNIESVIMIQSRNNSSLVRVDINS